MPYVVAVIYITILYLSYISLYICINIYMPLPLGSKPSGNGKTRQNSASDWLKLTVIIIIMIIIIIIMSINYVSDSDCKMTV